MPAIILILLGCAPYAQAAPQQQSAGIFGRVVNSETHEVVRRAAVKISSPKAQWDALTDGDGRFRFPDPMPGDYILIAHRDGYSERVYHVESSDFTDRKELQIELRPQGIIAGRAVDPSGRALQSVQIQALGARSKGGQIEVLDGATTNDLGEYRLSGLDPGTYQLRATYREGHADEFDATPVALATAYYGGSEKVSQVAVQSGAVVTGIDFVLNAVRPATIRGHLHSGAGALRERTTLWIAGATGEGGHNAASLEDDTFEIDDVGPGTYTISAETLNKSDPLFGITTVEVRAADMNSIDIVLKPVPKIEGELRMSAGSVPDSDLGSVYFTRKDRITSLGMQIAHPGKDHKFTIPLIPGEYNLTFDAAIIKLGLQRVTLDGTPITGWKLEVDESPETKKLVLVLGSRPSQ